MKKSEKFYEILRNAGITEYWADEVFDPDEEYPFATILINSQDSKLAHKLSRLYNDYENEDNCLFSVRCIGDMKDLQRVARTEKYSRRVVKQCHSIKI